MRNVLGDRFAYEAHGTIDVKDKGPIEVWFLRTSNRPPEPMIGASMLHP